jgi:polyhydroxyalkanoate synthesis regulator phasin
MFAPSADEKPDESREAGAARGLVDLIERVFLLGVGAAALSKDRLQETAEELVRRGHLSRDEGRDMVENLLARSRDELKSAAKKADSSLQGAYREMGLIGKREWDDMDLRLRQLEHRVRLLEAEADRAGANDQDP